uniref:SAC domain-containing protein n=1 Tax=Percolomonas cosmopolitus TaxID=63605 RepID=A0A7S1KPB5_9EUKA
MPFNEIELYDNKSSILLVPMHKSKINADGKLIEAAHHDDANIVHIDRRTGHIQKVPPKQHATLFDSMKSMSRILGVLGMIRLLSGTFLIVILKRDYVGSIKKHKVYRLAQIQFIPLLPSAFRKLSDKDREREFTYMEMLNKVFVGDRAHFFSYTCDLTQTFQRQSDILDGSFFNPTNSPMAQNDPFTNIDPKKPKPTVNEHSLWRYAHERFFWNHHLTSPLRDADLNGFIIPLIRGYVELIVDTLNKKKVKFGLISRVGTKRSGTRYNTRGADLHGNVANFVETEQFILHDGLFACHLQIRGSIPLIWSQYANLKYTPEIKFHKDKKKQTTSFKAHMDSVFQSYGNNISIVNLCKKKGQELILSRYYETLLKNVPLEHKVDYHAFDFHSETKGLRMDRISLLIDEMKEKVQQYAFHLEQYKPCKTSASKQLVAKLSLSPDTPSALPKVVSDSIPSTPPHQEVDLLLDFSANQDEEKKEEKNFETPPATPITSDTSDPESNTDKNSPSSPSEYTVHRTLQEQKGLFRVNCVDCCDRTNVVETAFGRVLLEQQLKMMGVFSPHESIIHHEKFNKIFQHFWANNGDRISSLYAGTGALMGDFTRTGQRSVVGFMKDGVNAVSRYVQNNFKDQVKQRSLHLVLGLLDVNGEEERNLMTENSNVLGSVF